MKIVTFLAGQSLSGSNFVKIRNSIFVFHFSWNHVVNDSSTFFTKNESQPVLVVQKFGNQFLWKYVVNNKYNRQQLRLTWITSSEPETTKQSSRMLSPLRNIKSPGAEWIMSKFTAKALQGKQSILIIMSICHTIQFELFRSKLSRG